MPQAAKSDSITASTRRQGATARRARTARQAAQASATTIAKLYLEWERHWAAYSKASASDDRAHARWTKIKPEIPEEIGVKGSNDAFARHLQHSFGNCGVVAKCRGVEWITPKGWRTLIETFQLHAPEGGLLGMRDDIDGVPRVQWLKQRRAIAEAFQGQVEAADKAWRPVDAARDAMNAACGDASEVAQRILDEDATSHADLKLQALVASKEGEDLNAVLPHYAAGLIRSLLQFVDAKAN